MHRTSQPGQLVYIVGASGSGKDSLMAFARKQLAGQPGLVFAHRYITRAATAGGENHVALSTEEFGARRNSGLFALDWASNGYYYGIGIEIDDWLARSMTVVVNGSRDFLSVARQRYPSLLPVWIAVAEDILRTRLAARGRESAAAIEARLERHRCSPGPCGDGVIVSNNGEIAEAGSALAALILEQSRELVCA